MCQHSIIVMRARCAEVLNDADKSCGFCSTPPLILQHNASRSIEDEADDRADGIASMSLADVAEDVLVAVNPSRPS